MNFEKFFKLISYSVALCGLLSLTASGGVGIPLGTVFLAVSILAYFLEDSRWQISERLGVILIVLIVPLFYLDWRYQISGFNSRDAIAAGSLARLILILSGIKLLQRKSDRDWIFLYLISFFEVLLAAGISISPFFLASLGLYLLFAVCSVVAFEIRKSSRRVWDKSSKKDIKGVSIPKIGKDAVFRLPVIAIFLLIAVTIVAVPLFFSFPRVGGAGFGNLGGLSGFVGFSDSVKLGQIGTLQQSDEVVMRVRLESGDREKVKNFRWRGVALDTFDNHGWRKSGKQYSFVKAERGFFQVDDPATDAKEIVTQTVYLEPLDTDVLFTLSRPVAIQGNFQVLTKNSEDTIELARAGWERLSYKVFSDVSSPNLDRLRADNTQYSMQSQRYLKLPDKYDQRITALAHNIIAQSGTKNRYDQAKAVESYLQSNYGYTLELKAGGDEPLADFLFNVREGHCEYFATAMAVMLRTQGIATRVVNGFQQGEYNETADVYVVKQKDAHSWVEVYFPKENVWVPFDPTPSAGKFGENSSPTAANIFKKYVEALETFWIQYVVGYDNQEQRTLFRSFRAKFAKFQEQTSVWANEKQNQLTDWWKEARGDQGFGNRAKAVGLGLGYLLAVILGISLIIWFFRRVSKFGLWGMLKAYLRRKKETSIVEFYERMQKILATRGYRREPHQTPLEFAFALNMPEAVKITERYNNVRFGEKNLSGDEAKEIENWLESLRIQESS